MGKGSARQGVKKTKRLTGNKKPVRQTKVRRRGKKEKTLMVALGEKSSLWEATVCRQTTHKRNKRSTKTGG